jgi:hypothetical protein
MEGDEATRFFNSMASGSSNPVQSVQPCPSRGGGGQRSGGPDDTMQTGWEVKRNPQVPCQFQKPQVRPPLCTSALPTDAPEAWKRGAFPSATFQSARVVVVIAPPDFRM